MLKRREEEENANVHDLKTIETEKKSIELIA
jgi:hypothetical protein